MFRPKRARRGVAMDLTPEPMLRHADPDDELSTAAAVLDTVGELTGGGSWPRGRTDTATVLRSLDAAQAAMAARLGDPTLSPELRAGLTVLLLNAGRCRAAIGTAQSVRR